MFCDWQKDADDQGQVKPFFWNSEHFPDQSYLNFYGPPWQKIKKHMLIGIGSSTSCRYVAGEYTEKSWECVSSQEVLRNVNYRAEERSSGIVNGTGR